MKKTLCLVWGPFGFRADELADAVGAERLSITFLYGPRYFAPIRYLVLFFRTLIVLATKRPDVILAQNPPVFCPLTCLLYCDLSGARLVVDHHSIWRVKTLGRGALAAILGMLERVVSRAAAANTAPHAYWARQLVAMGANRVEVVHDFVERNANTRDDALRLEFATEPLVAISSHGGHPLERMEAEAAAAGMVGEGAASSSMALLITGPREKLEGRLSRLSLPKNVRYLGFLERKRYEKLKASVDMAINITDEPWTLSHVLLEFAASSLPTISSRQEVVEDLFGDSLLYTDSTAPSSIAAAMKLFGDARIREDYADRIEKRYDELASSRAVELQRLRLLIEPTSSSASAPFSSPSSFPPLSPGWDE